VVVFVLIGVGGVVILDCLGAGGYLGRRRYRSRARRRSRSAASRSPQTSSKAGK